MKSFRQVFQDPAGGYFFRLTLPVGKFACADRYQSSEDAAFYCDVFKLYLVLKFKLTGNVVWPSLPPSRFHALLAEAGADRASSQSLFDALPQSCKDFLLDGGTEALEQYRDELATMRQVIS